MGRICSPAGLFQIGEATMVPILKLVFKTAAGLTAGCGLLALCIAALGPTPLTPELQKMFNILLRLFVAGAETVFRLLGGA